MLTGVCTTDFEGHGRKLRKAEDLFALIQSYGFSVLQFAFSSVAEADFIPTGQLEIPEKILPGTLSSILSALSRRDLPVRVVNGTFNMAHPDRDVRREGIRRFGPFLKASKELGASYISLCSGTRCEEHLWTFSPENTSEKAWEDCLDTVLRAVELAERENLTLAIESEASNVISTPDRARKIMDTVGSSRLKMILDPANLYTRGEAKPENARPALDRAFECFGKDIVIAHGKDIRPGDGIDFCGTGLGMVDFPYMAERLKQSGYAGDMFLHGIYDEQDMPRALAFWRAASGSENQEDRK